MVVTFKEQRLLSLDYDLMGSISRGAKGRNYGVLFLKQAKSDRFITSCLVTSLSTLPPPRLLLQIRE
jgi:hypothetical protein